MKVPSYYIHTILDQIGITNSNTQLLINAVLQIVNIVVAVGMCFFVDRLGRRLRVWRISLNSSCTTSSCSLAWACAFAKTRRACSDSPLEMSHRGDSGTNLKIYQLKVAHVDRGDQYHMKIICSAEGKTCTSDGALQAQFPWILLVPATGLAAFSKYTNYHRGSPNVNHAATRLPMYHVVL